MTIDNNPQLAAQRADLLTVYRALAEFGRKRREAKYRLAQSPTSLQDQTETGSQSPATAESSDPHSWEPKR